MFESSKMLVLVGASGLVAAVQLLCIVLSAAFDVGV